MRAVSYSTIKGLKQKSIHVMDSRGHSTSGTDKDESLWSSSVLVEGRGSSYYDEDKSNTAGPSTKPFKGFSTYSNCSLVKPSIGFTLNFNEQRCKHKRAFAQLISFCKLTEDKLIYFTGFEENEFKLLFDVITIPAGFKTCVENDIDGRDQFLLTLVKLRLNFNELCLAHLFNVKESFVNQVVEHWIHRMYIALKGVDFWALHEKQPGQYDVVIGCIEIPAETTAEAEAQSSSSSSENKQNTFKALIGVRESGAVVYCSSMWGGSTSVRDIVVDSDFLNHLKEGQHILADQSFNLSDILEKKKVILNIPSLKNVDRLRPEQVALVQRIAHRRNVLDRVITSAKEFQILSKPIPTRLWPICEEMLFVVVSILNFRTKVIEAGYAN